MFAVEQVLDALEAHGCYVEPRNNDTWMAQCPAHADSGPSLSIRDVGDRTLIYCFAGCSYATILAALELRSRPPRVYTPGKKPEPTEAVVRRRPTERPPLDAEGLTLRQYAAAKSLPLELLTTTFAMSDSDYAGMSAIRIPYLDAGAQVVAVRYRLGLKGKDRFRWRAGDKPRLYGEWLIGRAREKGYVYLVEGESDVHSLVARGLPALGVPGANTWDPEWEHHLDGIEDIFVWMEPDLGGETFVKSVARTGLRERMQIISGAGYKDASEWHQAGGEVHVLQVL